MIKIESDFEKVLHTLFYYSKVSNNVSTGTIARACGVSRFKVLAMIKTLIKMKYVARMPAGFKQRHYRFTKHFPADYLKLLDNYETYKILKREFVNISIKGEGEEDNVNGSTNKHK